MDEFASTLNRMVMDSFKRFLRRHGDERPYGMSLILGQMCHQMGFAVATEERLARTARAYADLGYTYDARDYEKYDLIEKLAIWMRWETTEDWWHYMDFENSESLTPFLERFRGEDKCDELLEYRCIESLRILVRGSEWKDATSEYGTVLGITYDQEPDDFLKNATMVNEYACINKLWAESLAGREIYRKINRHQGRNDVIL